MRMYCIFDVFVYNDDSCYNNNLMPTVRFLDDNIETDAQKGENLRVIAKRAGASLPFGCEQGICGTCLIDVKTGAEHVSPVEDQEKETLDAMGAEPGQRLACQCRAQGDINIQCAEY